MHPINPEGWPRPKGYSNGIVAEGRFVFVAGMVGWTAEEKFETDDFVGQFRQALVNTVAVLREGGAGPEHICRMTMYFTSKQEYLPGKTISTVVRLAAHQWRYEFQDVADPIIRAGIGRICNFPVTVVGQHCKTACKCFQIPGANSVQ